MRRRRLLTGLVTGLVAGASGLGAALGLTHAAAAAAERLVQKPADKAFAFLADYYRIVPARRSAFSLAYRMEEHGHPSAVRLTLVDGGVETALPVTPDGWLSRVPSSEALARGASVKAMIPAGAKPGITMAVEAVLRDPARIEVADLQAASDQMAEVVKGAGLMRLVIPRFTRAVFSGGEGATAIDAHGRETPLPLWKGSPSLDLTATGGARTVRFTRPPFHALLAPANG